MLVLFVTQAVRANAAAVTNAVPAVEVAVSTRSEFIDDLKFGKDPFFPKSSRRGTIEPPPPPPPDSLGPLKVQGISIVNGRRMVIINNTTFAEGDEANLRVDEQTVPVKCVQIRDQSVLVNVNNANRELPVPFR